MSTSFNLEVRLANYHDSDDQAAIQHLMQMYATDPMGGGEALSADVLNTLVPAMAMVRDAFTVLAFYQQRPIGIANCFMGFSTFAAQPLVNIHDLAVAPEFRGRGIGQKLLHRVEEQANLLGCCKITLEVLTGNKPALNTYRQFGFRSYQLDPSKGSAQCWQKLLS